IKAGAAPEPAAKGLVQQPAVGYCVHGGIWCVDIDRAKSAIPKFMYAGERDTAGVGPAKTKDQIVHLGHAATHPEPETGYAFLAIGKIESDLHRTARIQTGARFSGKSRPLQCCRLRQRPVAPEKFLPVTCERACRLVDIEEDDPVREFRIVKIASQQRATLEIDIGLNVEERLMAQIAQHPFAIAGEGETARPA